MAEACRKAGVISEETAASINRSADHPTTKPIKIGKERSHESYLEKFSGPRVRYIARRDRAGSIVGPIIGGTLGCKCHDQGRRHSVSPGHCGTRRKPDGHAL